MPIYEYQCKKCGQVTEVFEGAGAKGKHVCPKCESKQMEKLFSAFAVGKNAGSSGSSCSTGTCPTGTCSLS